ncbi:DUF1850 domain-containing protein [Brachyspira murdochii]|uniref:DUF1850 domain-containing protein n=1 Tax=Brachyspira murdochii TaxID=84378 RepID=A0ABX5B2C0_9SPIR|nr:DUF1850 domain-containing protein [Brachyspira murdochii]PPS21410.1 hypothetical protein DJ52_10995 [Brachyspira murdochii]
MFKKTILFTSIIIIFIVLLFIPLFPRLVLNSVKNNKINMILKIDNKQFVISYTHSVNKGRVGDFYFIDKNGNIVLDKTRFVSYGAGIAEPEKNENIVITDDYIEINNINRIIKNFYLFIGVVANHTIIIDDKIIELDKFFEPQTNIKIEYKKLSIFDYIVSFIYQINQ